MKFSKALTLALCLTGATSASAEDPEWVRIASAKNGDSTTWAKIGSLKIAKNKSGEPMAITLGRVVMKKPSGSTIAVEQWYVRLRDCERKAGTLVTLSVNGEFLYESDFVLGAGSVAAAMAEYICLIGEIAKKIEDGKGL